MKTITYGTFDLIHIGHINILKQAKNLGDFLIVGLSTDAFNKQKNKISHQSYEDRKKIMEAIRYVDLVIPEDNWEQKRIDIQRYKIDKFIIGDDWKGKFDDLKDLCEVIYIPRTPLVSSSNSKNFLYAKK